MLHERKPYDVVIVGGGASGTALLYALTKYTNINRIALLEKYAELGQVNSKSTNNSQTLHVGDIETNYSLEKATEVKPAANMLVHYVDRLKNKKEKEEIMQKIQKMILAVGKEEVEKLEKRYEDFKELYPYLEKLDREGISKVEPAVVDGRSSREPVLGLFTTEGYGVDYGRLAKSFVDESTKSKKKEIEPILNCEVKNIIKDGRGYRLVTSRGPIRAKVVVVDADSYSLHFAKKLGYGEEYSLIPIAGSFYFSEQILKGKVYTMQEPKLPFAAVHGDPDVNVAGATRWGPTARAFPVLESGKLATSKDYFISAGLLKIDTWKSFFKILFDKVRLPYLAKNVLYEIPGIGTKLFVKNVQKIVPSMKASDLRIAKGFGGMRLQRVDIRTQELQLGEGKIVGDNILFNMTPSPGASVCLYNAWRDSKQVVEFLGGDAKFEAEKMKKDFSDN